MGWWRVLARVGCRAMSLAVTYALLAAEAEKSRKLNWSDALRLSFGVDILTCPCGGKRRLIAVITQAKVIKKILRHLGLPTDVVLKLSLIHI